jgi:hypothetical protein
MLEKSTELDSSFSPWPGSEACVRGGAGGATVRHLARSELQRLR